MENVLQRVFVLRRDGVIDAEDLYFDVDMAEQKAKSEEPIEETSRLSHQKSILPITPKSIIKFKGSKSYPIIRKMVHSGEVHVVRLGSGKQRAPLIYLTPETASSLFRDTGTEDYRRLEERIRNNEFIQVAEQPFTFFSISDLIANPNTLKSRYTIKRAAKESGVYQVSIGTSSYFAITLSKAHYFISKGEGLEQRVGQLQETITESYEEFKNWLEEWENQTHIIGRD